jgi:hypothetical protein
VVATLAAACARWPCFFLDPLRFTPVFAQFHLEAACAGTPLALAPPNPATRNVA